MKTLLILPLVLTLTAGTSVDVVAGGSDTSGPKVSAAPNKAFDELMRALEPLQHVRGSFTQQQFDESDTLVQESTGSFRLLRPGYFAWEISAPDRQLVIADPSYIWHYDIDLETVTRRPVSGTNQMTPLQILGGDRDVMREELAVTQAASGEFTIAPRQAGAGFETVVLKLAAGQLHQMTIRDDLGQRLAIQFDAVAVAADLTPADFAFAVPEGADLFVYDQ